MKNVIGMGNALTDVVVNLHSGDILERFSLPGGSMTLVDAGLLEKISEAVASLPGVMSPGGSAANTVRALALLGASSVAAPLSSKVGFVGKTGRDHTGDFFAAALSGMGVESFVFRGAAPSGRCLSLVLPDGERTMVTFLGAAMEMSAREIGPGLFEGYDCLYLEGYMVQDHELILAAAQAARAAGLKVAIDLASFNVVEANRSFLHGLVAGHVDMVFANEQEAHAFTLEDDPGAALRKIAEITELAVVKIGMGGALIRGGGEEMCVGIVEEARRLDTTGAGDFYAAGFLHGLCRGLSLRQCGTIGAIAAGRVIEVAGTTLADGVWNEMAGLVAEVEAGKYLL